jgi:hypothetical protein
LNDNFEPTTPSLSDINLLQINCSQNSFVKNV